MALEVRIRDRMADGTVQQQASFSRKKTNDTAIHLTSAGLALQINDQKLLWFGDSNSPQWEALCKPYIYNVHGFPGTDIFVGTDGRGGRLFSFDQQTGEEKLNLKSEGGGGMADLEYLETHQSLAFSFGATRTQAGLMILSVSDNNQKFMSTDTHDRRARLACLGFWRHGAVYRVGRNLEQLGILDLRRIEPST